MMVNFKCQLIGVQSHPENITLGMSVREFPKRVSCTLECELPCPMGWGLTAQWRTNTHLTPLPDCRYEPSCLMLLLP